MKTLIIDNEAKAYGDKELMEKLTEFIHNDETEFITSSGAIAILGLRSLISDEEGVNENFTIIDDIGNELKVDNKGIIIDHKPSRSYDLIDELLENILWKL